MNIINKYLKEPNPIKRKALAEQAYLFYFNDFLTIARFAEYHETDTKTVRGILDEGKHWNSLLKIEAK